MAEVLESREAHYAVIGLVLLDLAIVLTELVLSSFYPSPELAPHLGGWRVDTAPAGPGASPQAHTHSHAATAAITPPRHPIPCPPFAVHVAEEALSYTSIGILVSSAWPDPPLPDRFSGLRGSLPAHIHTYTSSCCGRGTAAPPLIAACSQPWTHPAPHLDPLAVCLRLALSCASPFPDPRPAGHVQC